MDFSLLCYILSSLDLDIYVTVEKPPHLRLFRNCIKSNPMSDIEIKKDYNIDSEDLNL